MIAKRNAQFYSYTLFHGILDGIVETTLHNSDALGVVLLKAGNTFPPFRSALFAIITN